MSPISHMKLCTILCGGQKSVVQRDLSVQRRQSMTKPNQLFAKQAPTDIDK